MKKLINILLLVLLSAFVVHARSKHKLHHHHRHNSETSLERGDDIDSRPLRRQGIPDLLSMFGKETKDGTEYEAFGCKLTVSKDTCKINFVPDKTCKEKVSLGKLYTMLVKKGKLEDMTKSFLPIGVFQIESFNLDKCKSDIDFKASAKEPFDIIKEKLKVQKGTLEMQFNYKTIVSSPKFESIGININGGITIAGKSVPLEFHKKKDQKEANFIIKSDQITADDFSKLFSKKEMAKEDTPQKAGMFSKAVVANPSIHGTVSVDGAFEVVLSGAASGITGLGNIVLFVVAQKNVEEATNAAVVADIKDIQPTAIINSLTGKDLSDIPLLKDLKVSVALEISNGDMMVLKNEALNKVLQKYVSNAKTITKGTKIKLDIPLKEIIKKTGTKATLTNIPDSIFVKIFVTDGKVCCQFPDNIKMDLLNALVALIPNVPEAIFEKVLKTPPKITIKKFDVNVQTKAVDVQLEAPDEVKLGNDLIAIKDVQFDLSHKPEGSWDFKVKGAAKIGDGTLEVTVTKKGDVFELNGEIRTLTLKKLMEQFGGTEEGKSSVVSNLDFLNFGIKDVKVNAVFGDNLKLRVTGNPILFGWDGMFFEGMVLGGVQTRQMFLGVVMKNIRLDEIVEKLFKKKILQTSWMSQLTASILISNTDATEKVDFTLPELKNAVKLKKGVFLSTQLTIPNDCKGSALCEVAREKMKPGTKLRLEGEISTSGVTLRAVYDGNGFEFGKNFKLTKLQAVLKVAAETEFYFEGQMKLLDPPLAFTARISVGVTGRVELQLLMEGMWKRPFGLKYVAFGNIQMGVAIEPSVPIPKLELTGEVHLGKIGNGKEIISKSAISFDPSRPLDNYFYSSINTLTLESISKAFEFEISLPQVILESGFPEGLVAGFSTNPKGKNIEHLNAAIPAGFMLKGLINILGYKIKCDIVVDFPELIQVDAELSPIKIGKGLIAVSRSKNDLANGPKVFVKISKEEVAVKIQGYVSILGLGAEVLIDVSNKGFYFYVYGNIFNLIEANVTVNAPYGSLAETGFSVSSCISASVGEVTSEAKKTITTAADETQKVVSESKEKTSSAGSWYEKATEKLQDWVSKLEEKESIVQRKSNKLGKIKDFLDDKCVDQCEDVCIGGPTINKKCKKVFGKWLPCPGWDDCKSKIEDPICIAKCKGKKVYLEGKALKKKVTMEILLDAIRIIRKVIEFAKGFVDKSKELIDFAEKASNKIEEVAASGKAALEAIAKYTRENIINIHHICFNTSLEEAKSSCFGLKVNVTLGGSKNFNLDTKACLDVSFVKNIGKAIADQLFPGINTIKEKIKQVRDYMKDHQDKEKEMGKLQSEAKKEENELEGVLAKGDLNSEEDDGKTKKQTFPTPFNESNIRHQIYGALPAVTIRDDITLDAMETRSPWAFSKHDSPFASTREYDEKVNQENEENYQKEDIPTDFEALKDFSHEDSCRRVNSTFNIYEALADSLNLMSHKMKSVEEKYKIQRGYYAQGLVDAKDEITHNCHNVNMTNERTMDALYYVDKLKQGTVLWEHNVRQQIAKLDEKALAIWKEYLNDVAKSTDNVNAEKLMKMLTSASRAARKRNDIPDEFGNSLKTASKIVNSLMDAKSGSLSSNRMYIEELNTNVKVMRKALPFIACVE